MIKKLLIACKDLSKTFPGLDEEIIKKLRYKNLDDEGKAKLYGICALILLFIIIGKL